MTTEIQLSIAYNDQQLDYKVPNGVTLTQLVKIMHEVLSGARLPEPWTLVLADKEIEEEGTDVTRDLPIENGDVFVIVPLATKKAELSVLETESKELNIEGI
jgi:hypothetical protein